MATIYPEIMHADLQWEAGLVDCEPMPLATGGDAISIESVIYTRESLGIPGNFWFEFGLSPNPNWRRSMTGYSAHVEPLVARWFYSQRSGGSPTDWVFEHDLTKQIFLHGLIMPRILTVIHASDNVASYDINQYATVEVFYHEVSMGRDELVALDNRWGKYRRTS